MKKLLSLALAVALALSLAACGAKNNSAANSNDGANGTTNAVVENDKTAGEEPEVPEEPVDEVQPEEPTVPTEEPDENEEASQEPEIPTEEETITASHSDVTFKAAGDSFKLVPKGATGVYAATYTSADESIATVAKDGTVTAVAPGTTTISLHVESGGGQYDFECIIRNVWKEESETPTETPDEDDEAVDLHAFASTVFENYTLSMGMSEMTDAELIENYFPGLSDISLKQQAIYYCMMSMNNGEIYMVEVENSADVDTVKTIFQSRVDVMINGGAWYPEPTEIWTNSSRIVSSGNYVLMVASKDCDSIVADFEALVG